MWYGLYRLILNYFTFFCNIHSTAYRSHVAPPNLDCRYINILSIGFYVVYSYVDRIMHTHPTLTQARSYHIVFIKPNAHSARNLHYISCWRKDFFCSSRPVLLCVCKYVALSQIWLNIYIKIVHGPDRAQKIALRVRGDLLIKHQKTPQNIHINPINQIWTDDESQSILPTSH